MYAMYSGSSNETEMKPSYVLCYTSYFSLCEYSIYTAGCNPNKENHHNINIIKFNFNT